MMADAVILPHDGRHFGPEVRPAQNLEEFRIDLHSFLCKGKEVNPLLAALKGILPDENIPSLLMHFSSPHLLPPEI
ncbi:MAG: hypothetical protein AB7E77_12700 [Desulfobulbus sp.]